jgi:hypothetical protein
MKHSNNRDSVASHALTVASAFRTLKDQLPDDLSDSRDGDEQSAAPRDISPNTKMPKRYRPEWERPADATWTINFNKIMRSASDGGISALIGPRGTGKTRMAAEIMRDRCLLTGHYTTAMGLFIRIRASFGKASKETEELIVHELATATLLVIDEVQERGNTPWEDRLLTHILDRRYGAMLPTILIANLSEADLMTCLGDSIISRLEECGGVLEIKGPSHRQPQMNLL